MLHAMQRAVSFVHSFWRQNQAHRSADLAQALLKCRGLVPRCTGRSCRVVATAAPQAPTSPPQTATTVPQLPLCEREARHAVPLSDLLAWKAAAQRQVEAVGNSWSLQDEGPSAEDLQTELDWLLDDSLAAWAGPGSDWSSVTWQQLQRDLRHVGSLPGKSASHVRVQLREPLHSLETVWQQRLQQRIPLQYLTATAFWRDIVLSVGPGVLIPRPETELVIDFVHEAVAAAPQLAHGAWADLGTGSGALAVGVARALPHSQQVYAVDLSPLPLAYVAFNARRLGVGDRVTPVQGSWFEPLEQAGMPQLAGVVSNPPYICSTDMHGLQAEVGRHEPHLALHGGEGLGIDCLLPICMGAARRLQPGGFLALETAGGEQALYIAELLSHMRSSALGGGCSGPADGITGGSGGPEKEQLAFVHVRVRKDLRGVDRFVTASRAAAPAPASEE